MMCLIACGVLGAPAAPAAAQPQETRPSAEELVEEAWLFLPAYDGEHRPFLTEDVRRDTAVGAHLLAAAVELEPDDVRALWSLGHARVLLAEDRRNRGLAEEARRHYESATAALSSALELDPEDVWCLYARGAAHASFGFGEAALADLDRAVERADALLATDEPGRAGWLRFKALEWRPEVMMRSGDSEAAREALRAFHAEFSTNAFPLRIALAESWLRERNLAEAHDQYEQILAEFPSDHQAYALLGYLEGLLGDRGEATARLLEALERELEPGLYPRLWLWILATEARRPAAEADLADFLANPPPGASDWDVGLGQFALGREPVAAFLERARAEEARRMAAGEALDDLLCESWFYAGLRLELEAAELEDDTERRARLEQALAAHAAALAFDPPAWKWEWAFARLHLADLAATLDLAADRSFELRDDRITAGDLSGRVVRARWHAPRTERATAGLGRQTGPGDLLLLVVEPEGGPRRSARLVVGAAAAGTEPSEGE